jgi:hypothetical protein
MGMNSSMNGLSLVTIYLIVNVFELEVPPPGPLLNTQTCAVPAAAMSDAGIATVKRVAET